MVSLEKLYAATDDGLKIIELHYPEAREASRTKKQFKARQDERTPSASVKLMNHKGGKVWKMTDFGGEGRAMDPIEIHMQQTGISRFAQAIADLSMIFNVTDELDRAVNRPDIRKEPAREDQPDGSCDWDIDQEFTDAECRVMGPRVTAKHLKALNWYRVNRITSVRNREAINKYSNEHYPIFMRECWFTDEDGQRDRFYKVYEPLNIDKQWRFQYQPAGKKPRCYVNGLEELKARYKEYNDREAILWDADPSHEGKPYILQKLPEAIICSGERDALCVRSLGYFPLWFNSETYRVSDSEWKEINRYVKVVYNIPDIDETGIRKGTELALRFLDVHTIWLPEKLRNYRDNRGKYRKDFRDWMEIWKENSDFESLLNLADPAKYWEKKISVSKNKNGEEVINTKWSLDIVCLYCFLKLNGFRSLVDTLSNEIKLIHINGSVVAEVSDKYVRDFVQRWCVEYGLPRELRKMVMVTPFLSASQLNSLETIELDFDTYTDNSQLFFFENGTVEVTASGIRKHDIEHSFEGRSVWKTNLVNHRIEIMTPIFTITHPEGVYDSEAFDITINNTDSKWFCYLINSSRIFWREELEYNLEGLSAEEAEKYRSEHKFDIAGPNLTDEQRQIQKQCLISKIFTVGYMLHRYRDEAKNWAPYVMDNIVGGANVCNGRSGKSFMFTSLRHLVDSVTIDCKKLSALEGRFAFSKVKSCQALVVFDDLHRNFNIENLYSAITAGLTVEKKSVDQYDLGLVGTPKMAFTTNYVPREFSSSTTGRLLFGVTSDYYHQKSPSRDYKESRSIGADFGGITLFNNRYPERDWNCDFNAMMQCCQFWLTMQNTPAKIEPNMSNIFIRTHIQTMSESFKDWAEGYFAEEAGNLDMEIWREEIFTNYRNASGDFKMKSKTFKKSLESFVATCDHIAELNPADKCNAKDGRIIRQVTDSHTGQRNSREMFYLQSVKESKREATPPTPEPAPAQQQQVFVNQNPGIPERPTECPF